MMGRLLSALAGMAGGLVSGLLFKQVWKLTAGESDAPVAADLDRRWREVMIAAAVQGAIFGLVKAAGQRAAARSVHHRPPRPGAA
ncbi:DUF4235 domain-containing protein [Spongiactinospora sp. 9N601]|uniref:DUF4235 domain-containing protein n=1 Tax=Spongiactinospora sp. 9N601 TaxID=3375149 RepID=UPI0037B3BAF7